LRPFRAALDDENNCSGRVASVPSIIVHKEVQEVQEVQEMQEMHFARPHVTRAARYVRRKAQSTVPCQGAALIFRARCDVAFSTGGDVAESGSGRRPCTRNKSIKRDIGEITIASLLRQETKRGAYVDGTRASGENGGSRGYRRGDAAMRQCAGRERALRILSRFRERHG